MSGPGGYHPPFDPEPKSLTDAQLGRAGRLWNAGLDTVEIARELGLYERDVAKDIEEVRSIAQLYRREAA